MFDDVYKACFMHFYKMCNGMFWNIVYRDKLIFMKDFYMNYYVKEILKCFKRRLSAQGHEKAREFPRDPVLKDMRRYMGNPSYSYVHIEVDLAGASSLLRIEPGTISTLGVLSLAPPQLRLFSTLSV